MEFDGGSYGQALDEIKRIETHMCDIPYIVSQTSTDTLPHLRMVVTPCVGEGSKIALYLELQRRMNAIQASMAGLRESTDFCSKFEVDKLKRLLAELNDIDVGKCTWEFLESVYRESDSGTTLDSWLSIWSLSVWTARRTIERTVFRRTVFSLLAEL